MIGRHCFLHLGLPRTTTTNLQRDFWPNLFSVSDFGKAWDNERLVGKLSALKVFANGLTVFGIDTEVSQKSRLALPSIFTQLKEVMSVLLGLQITAGRQQPQP